LLPSPSVIPSISNCSFARVTSQASHVWPSLGLLQILLIPACDKRPFWILRRIKRRRDSCSIGLVVRADIPVALELPRREAADGRWNRSTPAASGRRDGSFPARTTSRDFARRTFSLGMVSLQGPAGWSCQMPGGPDACSRHSRARWKAVVSLHL